MARGRDRAVGRLRAVRPGVGRSSSMYFGVGRWSSSLGRLTLELRAERSSRRQALREGDARVSAPSLPRCSSRTGRSSPSVAASRRSRRSAPVRGRSASGAPVAGRCGGPLSFLAGIACRRSSRCSRGSTPTTTGCCRSTWSSTCCCCSSRRCCCWAAGRWSSRCGRCRPVARRRLARALDSARGASPARSGARVLRRWSWCSRTCRRSTTRRCATRAARRRARAVPGRGPADVVAAARRRSRPPHRLGGLGKLVYLLVAMLPMA